MKKTLDEVLGHNFLCVYDELPADEYVALDEKEEVLQEGELKDEK